MKKSLLFIVVFFMCFKISANSSYKLNVHFDTPINEKIQAGTKMDYKVYLVNNSGQQQIVYNPEYRGGEENRNHFVYRSDYRLYFNNDSIGKLYWLVEGARRKLNRKAEVKLENGDSILVNRGQLQPMYVGDYKFVFKHNQVKMNFSESALKDIGKDIDKMASFRIDSDTVRFTIKLDVKKDETFRTFSELKESTEDPISIYGAVSSGRDLFNVNKIDVNTTKDNKYTLKLIPYLKNVQWMKLTLTSGDSIPNELSALKDLVFLNITVVKKENEKDIPSVPIPNFDIVSNLEKLECLVLNNTFIKSYPKWIENLSSLRCFYSHNGLCKYEASFNKLSQSEDLAISGSSVAEFPAGVFNLPNLKKLKLGWLANPLPDKLFAQLPALEELIFTFHNSKGQLDLTGCNPKILDIDLRQSDVYPKGMEGMTNLENLILNGNCVDQSFPDLSKSKITRLEIINDEMAVMPKNIGNIKTLDWLIFKTPKLTSIEAIGACSQLKKLFINSSSLGDNISENLLKCTQIEVLSLCNSKMTRLGPIAKMNWLRVIYLEDNKIIEIAPEITNFTNLEKIWLQGNQLTHFPEAMLQLPKIETISLRKNPLPSVVKNRYKMDIEMYPMLKKLLLIDL